MAGKAKFCERVFSKQKLVIGLMGVMTDNTLTHLLQVVREKFFLSRIFQILRDSQDKVLPLL